ncbi:unnamed protein product [Hymenolepis diminuta]|uniref:Secreted protein n=1 Tax=Hymenolepis diminuta TaxID=6216 RepID=A0A564XZ19_HYMDI|nr:unnamed protein product [Hymenolepis diminuta]
MSRRVHRFALFSVTASLHVKGTSALMLWRDPSLVTHIKLSLFSRQEQHTLISADAYTSCSSPLFLSTLLSLPSPSLCYSLWLP